MRLFSPLRVITALLGVCVCLPIATLAQAQDAQAQQSASSDASVADAARRARDQKKNAAKSSKVITDDELDRHVFKPGQAGFNVMAPPQLETAPPSAEAVAAAEAADNASDEDLQKEAAAQDSDIARLKVQIREGEKDLDVLRRQLALDQDSYFSKTDYARDTAGKSNLDNEKQQINDRQEQIERLKTRLAALEELKSHRKPARKKAAPPAQSENPRATPPAQP
jgi:hypothetical protein